MGRLVLTRRRGESIDFFDGVGTVIASVTVDAVLGDRVRIGVEAPMSIGVHRREVMEKIRAEQQGKPPAAGEVAA